MTPKHRLNIEDLNTQIEALYALDPSIAMSFVVDATKTAKRILNRQSVKEGAERVEFVQSSGPTVEFTGKMLAEHVTEAGETELWLTLSGGWVLLNSYRGNMRAFDFDGDERTPEMVFIATGYADWVKPIAKKMGWQWRREID